MKSSKETDSPCPVPTLDLPDIADGVAMWRIARDTGVLDLNSTYSYLLWCRDFSRTSVVARDDLGHPTGFITGYIRPDHPQTLVIWQVAVDRAHRGRGLAGRMLDDLAVRGVGAGARRVETTITPGNEPSHRLFASFAQRRGARIEREVLFGEDLFPTAHGHEPEILYRISPLA
ncbi:diaminobutyrate acetyltransferase [Streptomyces sp. P3]|uniref:diaminobutyrate acetyltransferase n=1 Tax=unclassified Streptomyces TaxID=2593676 RepID=UPI000D1A9D4D|nr:diaminobutyrate acetyltransferase [Streptomyces sp. P3]AVV45126.1 diaminobutyrate acetyltransferase [Streptomyces sp. P3]MCQ9178616.1 diaminobutyrate acetyltransferase [Streptomyces hayashii]